MEYLAKIVYIIVTISWGISLYTKKELVINALLNALINCIFIIILWYTNFFHTVGITQTLYLILTAYSVCAYIWLDSMKININLQSIIISTSVRLLIPGFFWLGETITLNINL